MTCPKRPPAVFQAFKRTVLGREMIVPGDWVLAACSGGPDSMALVALLLRLREEMPLEIRLAHFNHRLRAEAEGDERFVREAAGRWVLPLTVESRDVRRYATRRKLNLEEAGRTLRYEFLQRAARKTGATKIATGHTMADQAETFLMRLMRGTGLTGLAGIAPVARGSACPIIRPLIEIGRADIEGFLGEQGIPWREDASNLDRRFLRNRIRLELLPELSKNYEPRIVEHLARLASLLREEEALLGDFVRGLAGEFISGKGARAALDARLLAILPPSLARRVVREFIREIRGDLRAVSFEDVEAVLALRDGKERPLARRLVLRREKGRIARPPAARPRPKAFEILWDGRGELTIEGSGGKFVGKTWLRGADHRLKGNDRAGAQFDRDKLVFPLVVRTRKPGDAYRPLGSPGRKKLKEILRARGVSREDRDRLPVFLSGGEIIWVPGLPVAEKSRIGARTRTVFSIMAVRPSAGAAERSSQAEPIGRPTRKWRAQFA